MRTGAGVFGAGRRLVALLVCFVFVFSGLRAANTTGRAALSAAEVEGWIDAFSEDYERRGAEALWSRLDEARLAERVAALDGLGTAEARRREELIRQRLGNDRVAYANFKHLTVGRRTDAGDYWTVLTHYNSDDGMFFYRRLRLEAGTAGSVRLADWANLPCDLEMAEDIATLALLQMREVGANGTLPVARRAELEFYRDNPQKLMQLYFALRATTAQQMLFRAVFSELPPVAKYGVVAREARTQWFVLLPSSTVAEEVSAIVGPKEEDALRGLLLFRAGLRGERPRVALEGMDLLSAQLGEDAMWRIERSTLLDHAGRLDEAAAFTRETAELHPTIYVAHVHHLAALRRAGRADEAERRASLLADMLGQEFANLIAQNAENFAREQMEREARIRSTNNPGAEPPPLPTPTGETRARLIRAPVDPTVFEAPAIQVTLPFSAGGETDHSLNREDYR